MRNKYKTLLYLISFLFFTLLISYGVVKNDSNTEMFFIDSFIVENETILTKNFTVDSGDENRPMPTIFCMILTSKKNFDTKTKLIHETWAKLCDNHKFVTTLPDDYKNLSSNNTQTNEIVYKNLSLLEPPGLKNDRYNLLTDKVYLTFKYLHQNYDKYDWYLKADDDTYIFVDNLRKFLSQKKSSNPVTYGYDFNVIVEHGYHSGGGGYVLSNTALNRIGEKLNENYRFCPNTGVEDVDVARCLRKLHVYPNKSIDELGRERFHPLSIMSHYYGHFPDWLQQYASNPLKKEIECCSDTSISFHYMSQSEIKKLDAIIKNFNNSSSSSESENLTFKFIIDNMINTRKRRRR